MGSAVAVDAISRGWVHEIKRDGSGAQAAREL
jgi:hypothetical protein